MKLSIFLESNFSLDDRQTSTAMLDVTFAAVLTSVCAGPFDESFCRRLFIVSGPFELYCVRRTQDTSLHR